MTDEEIHNIYLHMSGKAEGLVEATGTADFPVLFARAILEYEGLTKDVQNMASESTYKEQVETKDEPVAYINVEQRKLEWAKPIVWETPTVVNLPKIPLYTHPQPKQEQEEPVAWMSEDEHTVYTSKQVDGCFQHDHIPLYTTPQQGCAECGVGGGYALYCLVCAEKYVKPEWIGLTYEDIQKLAAEQHDWESLYLAVQTKLKEKNT